MTTAAPCNRRGFVSSTRKLVVASFRVMNGYLAHLKMRAASDKAAQKTVRTGSDEQAQRTHARVTIMLNPLTGQVRFWRSHGSTHTR